MIKKILVLYMSLYLVLAGIAPLHSVYAQEGASYTIAVLNMDAKGVSQVEAEVLSERLRSHISQLVVFPRNILPSPTVISIWLWNKHKSIKYSNNLRFRI